MKLLLLLCARIVPCCFFWPCCRRLVAPSLCCHCNIYGLNQCALVVHCKLARVAQEQACSLYMGQVKGYAQQSCS